MKGLILSGGTGTRLRPLTFTRAKQLIPIANKPCLFYVIEDLVAAGITSVGVIVSQETGEEIRQALGDGSRWGVRFTFILQKAPLGLADAVRTAREFLGDDPFVVYLGDNLLSGGIAHIVEGVRTDPSSVHILVAEVEHPEEFGVVVLDEGNHVVRLVEKPKVPPSSWALVGVYFFSPAIHRIIDTLKPSFRGEFEITDAIQGLIDERASVRAHAVRGWWKDTGKPGDLLDANRLILGQHKRRIEGAVEASEIVGEVIVEKGARIVASVVRGPAHIASGALIDRSYIGPYTSIGREVRLVQSEVDFSIIMDQTILQALPYRLESSVIGQGVVIDGRGDGPRKHSMQFVLGDYSRAQF